MAGALVLNASYEPLCVVPVRRAIILVLNQKAEIVEAISGLLDASEVQLEDEPAIEDTLFVWKDSAADFADCLIGAHNRRLGCRATATFAAKAVKLPDFVVI